MSAAFQGKGVSISSDGATAVVGAPLDSVGSVDYDLPLDMGATLVYIREAGVWNAVAKLVGTGATANAHQGRSVAISGDGSTIAVGGTYDSHIGAAWVFTRIYSPCTDTPSLTTGQSAGSCVANSPNGFVCELDCSSGYSADGSLHIACHDGTWLQSTGNCKSKSKSKSGSDGGANSTGLIVGAVVGSVVGGLILTLLVWKYYRGKTNGKQNEMRAM